MTISTEEQIRRLKLLEVATDYVENRDWAIINVEKGKKIPVRGGWQKTTVKDCATHKLKLWFKNQGSNIGILCGSVNNITVIDIDDDVFFPDLIEGIEYKDDIRTLTSWRGNKHKRHLFFEYDESLAKNLKKLFKKANKGNSTTHKIEILNDGRFVVAAPSIHPSGDSYEWKIDAPIIKMHPKFRNNLIGLIKRDLRFRKALSDSRPWITKLFLGREKRAPILDMVDFYGSDGRYKMLHVLNELKAAGAKDDILHYALKLIYKRDYNESQSKTDIDGLGENCTGRLKTIQETFTEISFDESEFFKPSNTEVINGITVIEDIKGLKDIIKKVEKYPGEIPFYKVFVKDSKEPVRFHNIKEFKSPKMWSNHLADYCDIVFELPFTLVPLFKKEFMAYLMSIQEVAPLNAVIGDQYLFDNVIGGINEYRQTDDKAKFFDNPNRVLVNIDKDFVMVSSTAMDMIAKNLSYTQKQMSKAMTSLRNPNTQLMYQGKRMTVWRFPLDILTEVEDFSCD